MHIDNVPNVIAACCVLHNVCEVHGDTFNNDWLVDVSLDQPDNSAPSLSRPSTAGGDRVRMILMDYFNQ